MPVVDLRFMVHNQQQVKDATKSLLAFNTANVQRAANYDKVAAADIRGMTATAKLNRMKNKLQSDLIKLEKEGILTKEELIQKEGEYNAMLVQEERTLKDFVETDRTLIAQEKRKQKMVDESIKKTIKQNNETKKLRMSYDSAYAAEVRYAKGIKDIKTAFAGVSGGAKLAERAIEALKKDYDLFVAAHKGGKIVDAGNQFARYGDQAYRAQQKIKRFASVGLQQAGYQVNDFIVQIASGQNALVAFGQQGSQLAGIFGTKGAVAGAFIAGASALGNLLWQMYQAKTGATELQEALEELGSTYSELTETQELLSVSLTAPWQAGSEAVDAYLKAIKSSTLGEIVETGKNYIGKEATRIEKMMETFGSETGSGLNEQIVNKMRETIFPELDAKVAELSAIEDSLKAYAGAQRASGDGRGVLKTGEVTTSRKDVSDIRQQVADYENIMEDFRTLFADKGMNAIGLDDTIESVEDLVVRILDLRLKYDKLGKDAVVEEIDGLIEKLQLEKEIGSYKAGINEAFRAARNQDRKDDERFKEALRRQGEEGDAAVARYEADKLKKQKDEQKRQDKLMKARWKAFMDQMNAAAKLAETVEREERAMQRKIDIAQVAVDYGRKSVEMEELLAEFAREDYKAGLAKKGITDHLLFAAMSNYDLLQLTLKEEKELTLERDRQLRITRAEHNLRFRGEEAVMGQAVVKPKGNFWKTITYEEGLAMGISHAALLANGVKPKKTGGKSSKSALDILLKEERSMDLKLDQRRALIGLTDQEILLENTKYALMSKVQEQMATMNESEKAATIAKIDGIAQEMAAREEQIKLLEEVEAQNKHIADTIANSMGDAFMSIVDGTKSVKDAFKDMARAIIAELYQIFVVKQITGMIAGSIGGFLGNPTLAGGYSPGGKTYGSGRTVMQNGGAFYGGNVIPFADGGVIGGPTNFGMSGGRTGLMGEAGPEAIMPLKRGANGKLGVQSEGGSGDVVIHQNFNFAANGDESVKKLIAQAAPQIANMTKSSIISDRRRGGQMKATFG